MACDICLGRNEEKCPVCGTPTEKIKCPMCEGYGLLNCEAYIVDSDDSEFVSAERYLNLPLTEEQARLWGQKLFRGDADVCQTCCGHGEVFEEDGEYYPII